MLKLLKSNNYFFLLIFISFNIRITFVLVDTYFLNHFFTKHDSIGFHLMSMERFDVFKASIWAIENNVHYYTTGDLMEFNLVRHTYPLFLSFIYWLINYEYVLGAIISLLFWILNFFLLKKILDYLCSNNTINNIALTIFCFLPSSILFSSMILRESLQSLLICLIIYSLIRLYYEKKIIFFFNILIAFLILQTLHLTFLLYLIIFLALLFVFMFSKYFIRYFYILISVAGLLLICIFYFDSIYSKIDYFLYYFSDYILYRNISSVAYAGRTNFINSIDIHFIDSYYDFSVYLFIGFIKYLFYPLFYFPNFIYFDIIFILENFLRLFLIFSIILNFLFAKKINKISLILFLLYLFFEFIWSLGTVNYGTAIRHHYPQNSILITLLVFSTSIVLKFNLRK